MGGDGSQQGPSPTPPSASNASAPAAKPPASPKKSFSSLFQKTAAPSPPPLTIFDSITYKGEPGIKIPTSAVDLMSRPFQYTLVGKFSHGRPTMERSRAFFHKLGLKGNFSLGHLDPKHMMIRLEHEDDFKRVWMREIWYLDGYPMRSFRWSPDFRLDVESSVVPVWISLPNLPLFLINKNGLFSIGSLLGKPLTLDAATSEISRPSVARICVEIDLLKNLLPRVWVDCDDYGGFWHDVIYEKLPQYCNHCKRLGHDLATCKIAHPPPPKNPTPKDPSIPKTNPAAKKKANLHQKLMEAILYSKKY